MNSKKLCMFFLVGLFILIGGSNFVKSDYTDSILNASSKIADASSNFFGGTSGSGIALTSNWAATGKQWKDSLMANPFVMALDSFFQKINFVFLALFGIQYSLSLALFLTLFLWFYFFFLFNNILKMSLFSKGVCLLVSLGLTIVSAQVGLFSKMVNFIIQLFFGEKTWWMKVIIGVLILLGLVLVFAFIKRFGKQYKENKKKWKDEENRLKLEVGAKAGEALSKAVSKQ
jgi:uncharacterized membrane protein YuzA (DUF378 family)